MLTRKQHELLMFIHERIKESGVSPSFDEMKDALDLASKSGIHRLITALEERGFLRRLAAGTPIEAIQQEKDRIHVPETILGAGEHFVLEIAGDSMINAGILDG